MARSLSSNSQTLKEKILWDDKALGAFRLARVFKGGHEGQTIDETIRVIEENVERLSFQTRGNQG